jgi:hypothetical protein
VQIVLKCGTLRACPGLYWDCFTFTVFWIIRLILVWICICYLSGAEIFQQNDGYYFICVIAGLGVVSLQRGNLSIEKYIFFFYLI